ncbi:penicillin-binding protein activator [Microbulbifer thermotolerans]|uniref:LppC family lipoprotein n=1 Tax=Microbulbifer thermotolerans TaxID=252514 RepID=A0A143HQU7_MICTH|nr:penicillin-binding protein activator [Microbulbifer thermotolerans]AMX04068.1 LppC family lipoprotein [Microbulbifer thermotolerans]MCX2780759.1 penicillin-binding protein activator [Microbulbifer thermotolerans]MCX2806442.1 penicillin-binding protein activator [Microbulbifer thermotolerans]MCX2830084.1 penicillin-binding protein activator [Microbulbifer thermotolerans]WKT61604.1 penicillin-binding protein activator [Microbulbifer thermotolerans]
MSAPGASSLVSRLAARFAAGALTVALAACQTPATRPDAQLPVDNTSAASRSAAIQLLHSAESLPAPERDKQRLQAAAILYELGDKASAKQAVAKVAPEQLDDLSYARYARVYGGLLSEEDEFFRALDLTTAPRLDAILSQLPADTALPLRDLRADLWGLLGDLDSAIAERRQIAELARTDDAIADNNNGFWQLLTQLPSRELQLRADESSDPQMRGWYQLALLGRDTQTDISSQLSALTRWRQQWPHHSANTHPPQALQLLEQLATQRADHIALLLPLSGPLGGAGRAIRDGFMAAYYTALNAGAPTPAVQVYDTGGDRPFEEIYQSAVDAGAQAIVGPLDKRRVSNLLATEKLPVPTLALNYGDEGRLTGDLVQFGLAIEDEARQVARHAYLQGHRQAMILATDSGWGQRGTKAFQEEWQRLGGTVTVSRSFNDNSNFSRLVSDALLISDSKAREASLRRKLAAPLAFTPRRRGDVDMIFLLAQPQQARQINPMLAFFYAGDLPVYATSQVFGGRVDPQRDRDINGIRFTALPWLFEDDNLTKRNIEAQAAPAPAFARLYALGADAFRLFPRIPMLRRFPEQRVHGLTGALSLTADGRIVREQIWARIKKGAPVPITTTEEVAPQPVENMELTGNSEAF